MNKSIVVRSAFVFAVAALGTFAWAALDLDVTGVDVSGAQISVTLHNPSQSAETAAVRVTVLEAGGSETLQSAAVTVAAGATQTVTMTASHAIVGIGDSPEPVSN